MDKKEQTKNTELVAEPVTEGGQTRLESVKSLVFKGATSAKDGVVAGAKKAKELVMKPDYKKMAATSKQWVKDNPKKAIGAAAGLVAATAALVGRKVYRKRKAKAAQADDSGGES